MLFHQVRGLLLGAAALLLGLSSTAQSTPRYNALLWRISGGDAKKVSYLYGTMHVSRKTVFQLSEEFFTALNNSDVVALEMDPERWLDQMVHSEMFTTLSQLGNNGTGSEDLYHDAFKLSFPDRRSIAQSLAQDPEVVDDLLYRVTDRSSTASEETYLDLFIYQHARRSGKPVVGLEELDHALTKVVMATAPDGSKDDPAREKRMREAYGRGQDPEAAMEDSYRTQDLDRMDSLFDLSYTNDRMRHHLIDERNADFVEALLPMLRDRSVFAGVGALHLPGVNGMVEMLRAKGYTVEPVVGNITSRSRADQREHERTILTLPWKVNAPKDSAFTIELPTVLHPWEHNGGGNEVLLAADMVNSSHFVVQRIPTYAGIRGVDDAYVLAQVDSALYEGIPGRIEKHAVFTANNGWPGRDVRARDQRGRVVHYRVVVSPFEIFIFSRVGRDLPRSVRDGERAFASIRFRGAPAAGEGTWVPNAGGLQLVLPNERHVREQRMPMGWLTGARVDRLHVVQARDTRTPLHLLQISSAFQDVIGIEQDTFELNVLAASVTRMLDLRNIGERSYTDQDRTLRCSGDLPGGERVHLQVALDGTRYDVLVVRGSREAAERCFVGHTRQVYRTPPLKVYHDSLMHFTAHTAATHEQLMGRITDLRSYFQRVLQHAQGRVDPERAESNTILYHSTTTPEAVLVEMERYHRFRTETRTEEEFWDAQVENLTNDGRYVVRDRHMTGAPEHRVLDLYLADTASSRTVRVSWRQFPGGMHLLRAPADAQGRTTAWVDSFMTTFRADTTFGEGLWVKKGGLLLEWLAGTDSLKRKQAIRSLEVAKYTDADTPGLIAAYRETSKERHGGDHRDAILSSLSGSKHPDVLPFLRERYLAAGDSVRTQCTVLRVLSEQHTKAAAELFLELMLTDPPLVEQEWLLWGCFRSFHDSLSAARHLFPKAWELMRFPEFEGPVLRLAATLVDRGELGAKDLAQRWPELLPKAKVELKRATAAAKQSAVDGRDEDEYQPLSSERNHVWNGYYRSRTETQIEAEHRPDPPSNGMPLYLAYHHLLQPFAMEPTVKAYFDGALASDADAIVAGTAPFLMQHGRQVPAEIWQRLAQRDGARLWTYRTLKALGHGELFGTDRLGVEHNAAAYLLSGWSNEEVKDVEFIGTESGNSRLGEGPVRFYTSLVKEEGESDRWQIMATGYFRDDDAEPFADRFMLGHHEYLNDRNEIEAAKKRMLENMRYVGRTRWKDPEQGY